MKYLKIFTDFRELIDEDYADSEVGRLFKAMLDYASDGTEPLTLGREKTLFKVAKQQIDAQKTSYEYQCIVNKKNAQKKQANRTESHRIAPNRTESVQDQDQDQDKTKTKERGKKDSISPFDQAIADFAAYRKLLKKPLTQTGINRLKGELEKLAPGDEEKKIAILEQSQYKGWIGVFQLKDDTQELQGDGMDNLRRLYEANRNE